MPDLARERLLANKLAMLRTGLVTATAAADRIGYTILNEIALNCRRLRACHRGADGERVWWSRAN